MQKVREKIYGNLIKFIEGDSKCLIVGVSGGADSMCLLHNLDEIRKHGKLKFNLVVCHLHHMIRLDGTADRDYNFVENYCKEHDIIFEGVKVNIPERAKAYSETEEEAGRNARYEFFNEIGRKYASDNYLIVTGANANDTVETVLMRMMRGTSVTGLAGIPMRNGNIIRPMADCTRDEIEEYLKDNNLTHITDETNLEAEYTRNKIRLELIPYIIDNFNPNFVNTLLMSVNSFREDSEYLTSEADRLYSSALIDADENKISFDINKLKEAHRSIVKRVLYRAIKQIIKSESIQFKATILDAVADGLDKTSLRFTVSKDCNIYINYDKVTIESANLEVCDTTEKIIFVKESIQEIVNLEKMRISLETIISEVQIENKGDEFYIPYEEFNGKKLVIRRRKKGDMIRISPSITKKVGKLLSEKHVPVQDRDRVYVLESDGMIYSVLGVQSTRFNTRVGKFLHFIVR